MTPDKNAVRTYFAKLGLEPEIADLYLALHAQGPQTISELARNSSVERTRIYRLIDQLLESGLIEVESHAKRGILKAAPISNLRILISKREQELQGLQDELGLVEQVLGRNQLSSPATRVQFYSGPEGIKQMFWNETKANTEICGVLYENIQIHTGNRFFERWTDACNAAGLRFRGIVGPDFAASQQAWYGSPDIGSGLPGTLPVRLQHWEQRTISPEDFPIAHSTIVYDDIVGYFNWKDNEVYGIEVYNKQIADAQRHYFELLWRAAAPQATI